MSQPEPVNADFVSVDLVDDQEAKPASSRFAVVTFETAHGLKLFRIPIDGALQMMTALEELPLERHTHYHRDPEE